MKRAITAVAIVGLTAAVGYASGPPKLDPGLQAVQVGERRQRERLQHRLGQPQQPDDLVGGELQPVLSEREDPDRGQGLVHRAAGADLGHRAARADVAGDEGDRGGRLREEVRLQADTDPHLRGRARGLRQQGQPDQVHDDRAGGRDLLEVPAAGLQGGRHHVGAARPHRGLGEQAPEPLRAQLGLRHVRVLQGAHAQERRLQGLGQGAARVGGGGPGRHGGPLRHRL